MLRALVALSLSVLGGGSLIGPLRGRGSSARERPTYPAGRSATDEPIAADAGQEAGDLVGVLSVGDVRICQPACAIACEREACDARVQRANVCRHSRWVGGDRDPELGGEVAELVGDGMVIGVVEVAVGECERRAARGGGAGGRQGGLVRGHEDVGVGRDQLGELPRAVGCGEDELGGGRLAPAGVADRVVRGPAVSAAGEVREPYSRDVQAWVQRAAVACGREGLGCERRQAPCGQLVGEVAGVRARDSGRDRAQLSARRAAWAACRPGEDGRWDRARRGADVLGGASALRSHGEGCDRERTHGGEQRPLQDSGARPSHSPGGCRWVHALPSASWEGRVDAGCQRGPLPGGVVGAQWAVSSTIPAIWMKA